MTDFWRGVICSLIMGPMVFAVVFAIPDIRAERRWRRSVELDRARRRHPSNYR